MRKDNDVPPTARALIWRKDAVDQLCRALGELSRCGLLDQGQDGSSASPPCFLMASMYRHILIAMDESDGAVHAATHAYHLAVAIGARITLFHASPEYPFLVSADGIVYQPLSRRDYAVVCRERTTSLLDALAQEGRSLGLTVAIADAVVSTPWQGILDAARAHRCDTIVMASHGRGAAIALLLGSQTQKVSTHSKLPVLVVPSADGHPRARPRGARSPIRQPRGAAGRRVAPSSLTS